VLVADRYRLSEVLGRGGMGEVWLGRDRVLDRPVAVKLVRIGDDDGEDLAARFELEARTAARLNHPNVVTVFDFGRFGGNLFLVMELLGGETVAGELAGRGGRLEPARVASIGAQVAAGLAAAHRHGVVHRDVKPSNLLLATGGTVKIGDFGIARFAGQAAARLTVPGQVVGTSYYLSPERIRCRAAVPASDVYALGCVLYELLTGRPPLHAATPMATLDQHLNALPEPVAAVRPDAGEPLAGLIAAMLAKDPDRRPTARRIAAVLTAALPAADPLADPAAVPAAVPPAVPVAPPAGGAPAPAGPSGPAVAAPRPAALSAETGVMPAAVAAPAPDRSRRQRLAARLHSRTSQLLGGCAVAACAAAVVLAFGLPGQDPAVPHTTPATDRPTTTRTAGGTTPAADSGLAGGPASGAPTPQVNPTTPAGENAGHTKVKPTKPGKPKATKTAKPHDHAAG
jgi:serine/threonine-protein kinase